MGKGSPQYAITVGSMAYVYYDKGELDRALEMREEVRAVLEVS